MSEVIINHFGVCEKIPNADYSGDGAGAMRGFMVESKKPPWSFSMRMTKLSSSLRTHTPLHLGLCLKVSVSLSSMTSRKFIGPVTFITFRKAPGILPVRRKTTKLLSSLMSRAASGFKAI